VPSPRKPDQSAPRPASATGVTNGQSCDPDPRAQSGEFLTSAQGLRLQDTDHSLKAGARGPTLLEDFHLREKITHFDHERIPERVVHARGAAAHGVFESYGNAASVTKARFLGKKGTKTEVFTCFSTVLGSRGSADTDREPLRAKGRTASARSGMCSTRPDSRSTTTDKLAAPTTPSDPQRQYGNHGDGELGKYTARRSDNLGALPEVAKPARGSGVEVSTVYLDVKER
jgi:hypothetical protein